MNSDYGRGYIAFLRFWGFNDPGQLGRLPREIQIFLEEAFFASVGDLDG
ncbi:MAG: hypothetical protein HXS43_11970 [Theionarchaea archaeon]|nr:hypothetical protein [Theionarchaea archaeon]